MKISADYLFGGPIQDQREYCLFCARDFLQAAQQARKEFGSALIVADYLHCARTWLILAKNHRSIRKPLP